MPDPESICQKCGREVLAGRPYLMVMLGSRVAVLCAPCKDSFASEEDARMALLANLPFSQNDES